MTVDVNTAGVNDGDTVRLFYKPDNTATVGYQLITEGESINDLGSGDVIIHTPAVAISPELYINSTEVQIPAEMDIVVASHNGSVITLAISGTDGNRPDGMLTQRLLLRAADSMAYFDAHVEIEATEDFIQPGFNSTVVAGGRLLLTADPNTVQQALTAVTSDGIIAIANLNVAGTIPSVVLFANPMGVSVQEIIAAVDASTTGTTVQTLGDDVDTIARVTVATEGMVQNVHNATGYTVGNGNTGTGGRAGSRLNGIRPKSGDYDPTQDYTTVL